MPQPPTLTGTCGVRSRSVGCVCTYARQGPCPHAAPHGPPAVVLMLSLLRTAGFGKEVKAPHAAFESCKRSKEDAGGQCSTGHRIPVWEHPLCQPHHRTPPPVLSQQGRHGLPLPQPSELAVTQRGSTEPTLETLPRE